MDSKEKEKIFIQHLKQGVLLLAMKEFNDFHFKINKDNKNAQELGSALLKEGVNINNYNRGIRQLAVKLLSIEFSKTMQDEMYKIFSEIEMTYKKSSPEICKTAIACKYFLEDSNTVKNQFPPAIARIMEDVLKTFKTNQ